MFRQSALRLTRSTRSFSSTVLRAAEGDTGGIRSGGSASSDAFTKREQASELKFIRDKERESLLKLREKVEGTKKQLKEMEEHIKEVESQSDDHR